MKGAPPANVSGQAESSAESLPRAAVVDDAATAVAEAEDKDPPSAAERDSSPRAGDRDGLTPLQRRLLACLGASTLLVGCCTLVYVPFFPHEARLRGLSATESGSVFSAYALAEMLAYPTMGWLTPRLGAVRLYQLGMGLAGLSTVIFGLLGFVTDVEAFFAASVTIRAAEAIGVTATQTTVRTIVANQFPDRLNTVVGFVETMSGAGLCLGPALGGALYSFGGYGAPFYLLGGLQLMVLVISLVAMPAVELTKSNELKLKEVKEGGELEGGASEDGKAEEMRSGCWSWKQPRYLRLFLFVITRPDNWLIFVVLLVISHNWVAMDPNLEVYVNDTLQMGPAELGLFFLGSFLAYAAASPLWGRISDSVNNTFLLVACLLAPTSLSILLIPPSPLLGLSPSRLLLGLGMVFREFFQVGAYLTLLGLLLRRSVAKGLQDDVDGQAVVVAIYGTVYSIGKVAAPMVGSWLTDRFGYPALGTCLGVVTAAVSLMVAVRGAVYACRKEGRRDFETADSGALG